MKSSLRLAGAAVLCASLLLTACAKSHESSTSTTTDASKTTDTSIAATPGSGTSAPDATTATGATAGVPTSAPAATTAAETTTTTTATTSATAGPSGAGGTTFIEIPVYPGAAELKDQSMAMSANGSSVAIKAYATKDDTKRVIDWYKSHLPASWQNFQLSSGDKTTGTFSSEGTGGDQTVIIATQDDKTTRIQLSTKHGK